MQSIREDMCRVCASTKPFYIRDLSIQGLWYPLTKAPGVPRDDCKALITVSGLVNKI